MKCSSESNVPNQLPKSQCNEEDSPSSSAATVRASNEHRSSADAANPMQTRDDIFKWQVADVVQWASNSRQFTADVLKCLQLEQIDGQVLLCLTEEDVHDFRYRLNYNLRFGELKKLWCLIWTLQQRNYNIASNAPTNCSTQQYPYNATNVQTQKPANSRNNQNVRLENSPLHHLHPQHYHNHMMHRCSPTGATAAAPYGCGGRNCNIPYGSLADPYNDCESCAPEVASVSEGCSANIPPEFFKTAISLGYSFVVTWITSFVMVIVHERVPDMKRYPPLPDIFLDNVPHIPWAFHMCEITGTLLFSIWACVCIFHKYRMVILRRFFALAGTVFLLRCVTMLITSLSVPGTHLQCNQNDYAIDDSVLSLSEAVYLRISRAYTIWSGLGMSIQGVRTCGDYMFSGHTVALTLLNFFITEYTPRNLYFLHTLSWLLNMFGIFFILAAHEHYSIDVFVAFYITSRLFLYYHTLANNQALMQRDSNRTRIWFPMFSYFESSVDGIIPNEFDSVSDIIDQLLHLLMELKDTVMMTTHRLWLEAPHLNISSRNVLFVPRRALALKQKNASTSTNMTATNTPTTASARQMDMWENNDESSEEELTQNASNRQGTSKAIANREFEHKTSSNSMLISDSNDNEQESAAVALNNNIAKKMS